MKELAARKILLPCLELTEVTDSLDTHAIRIARPHGAPDEAYYVRPKHIETPNGERIDSKPRWMGSQFNLFPVVLNRDGSPWAEANIYLLSRIESSLSPSMATYASIADSLAGYRRFLDETELDWTQFPEYKLKRPTYRYHGFLKYEIAAGKMKASTAKRRMSAVISFYAWLKQEGTLTPSHSPWKESDCYKCNSQNKGAKDPLLNDDGTRRRAFYPYSLHNYNIQLSIKFLIHGQRPTKPEQIQIELLCPTHEEELATWDSIYKVKKRLIAKCCSIPASNHWMNRIQIECQNYNRSPEQALEAELLACSQSPWVDASFLKAAYLQEANNAGLIS